MLTIDNDTSGVGKVRTELPVLFFDDRDAEWSVVLPSGQVLADLVALGSHDATVKALGEAAADLNQTPTNVNNLFPDPHGDGRFHPYCPTHDMYDCWFDGAER